jgi:chromosome partitioning protein
MPVIVIASPKGGAGKSTTAVILGTELAQAGAQVTMMDCDPNQSLSLWSQRSALPDRMRLVSDLTEASIIKSIKECDEDGALVVVDLEGVASRLVSRAISQADLVIIPMRPTTLDANIGVRALALIAEEEEALSREIPHCVVFTMTSAIQPRSQAAIEESLIGQGVDVVKPYLMQRAAYAALFEFGGNLRTIPAQGNMQSAQENAQGFAQAVFARLTRKSGEQGA